MSIRPTLSRRVTRATRATVVAAVTLLAAAGFVVAAAPAHAAGPVTVHVEGEPSLVNVADPTYLTELRVTGTGFQSVVNGFGGMYVMFGWAGDGWRPSQGGATGTDYRTVPDDESNPTGYVAYVAFPGSSTADAANGGEISADGSWSAVVRVPGATFTSLDRHGKATQVDCRAVQCGIITIGAHGVTNANNETFTPITFRDLYDDDTTAGGAAGGADGDAAPTPSTAPTPAPTTTTVIVEEVTDDSGEPAAAPAGSSDTEALLTALLWGVIGVGVLALAAIAFLVWAVLSTRSRTARADTIAAGDTGTE